MTFYQACVGGKEDDESEWMNQLEKRLAEEFAARLRVRLGDNLVKVILFGSRARGDAREGSDFDFVVVLEKETREARETVLDIEVEMMNELEELFVGMIYEPNEWTLSEQTPMGWNIEREGVSL